MRTFSLAFLLTLALTAHSAEVESRVLTHYVPQDFLEGVVRKEGWSEVALAVKGGVHKGDTIRIWAGGSIDRGGERPGENVVGPSGLSKGGGAAFALSSKPEHAYALLVKTGSAAATKCAQTGKALEIKVSKDGERLSIGFNDERSRYHDNRIGKGRRHEFDPLWVRIEVVRTVVD